MEKEIIILFGSGRVGKTTYANQIKKEKGYEYIEFDQFYHYGGKQEYFKFLDNLSIKLNDNPDKNYVLDGYIYFDKDFIYLRNKLKYHKVKPIMVFAKPEVILTRAINMNTTMTKESIIETYKNIINNWDIDESIDNTNNDFKKVWKQKIYNSLLLKQDVINFLGRLKGKNYDKYYQTIELPFEMKIDGYNANYEHKSWKSISEIYDFKNKRVADIGCFNGYFCFEMKNSGSEVIGYDRCIPAIETAKEIANLKGLDINFKVFDIEKQEILEEYDLILFLNISHHLKSPGIVLSKIFSKAKAVIVEMQFSNISREKVFEIAGKYGHKLNKKVDSARPNRTIMLFSK